jgi:hypothetical protein
VGVGNIFSMGFNLALLALFACLVPSAAVAINKCKGKDGATVYQDAPCDNASTSVEKVKTWDNSPGNYTGYSSDQSNEKIVGPEQAGELLGIYRRWIDAERLALSTGRIALSGPVASLQALQREAESAKTDICMSESKAALVELIKKNTTVMLQFMRRDELGGMVYQFLDRPKMVARFEGGIKNSKCKS